MKEVHQTPRSKKKLILWLTVFNVVGIIIFVVANCSFFTGLLLLLWCDFMLFSLLSLKKRTLLAFFGITFFVFLLGREFLQEFFSYKVEDYSSSITFHAELMLFISLAVVFLTYAVLEHKCKVFPKTEFKETFRIKRIRFISKYLFYIFAVFAIVYAFVTLSFIIKHTYYYTYTDEYYTVIRNNLILYALSKTELFMPIALYAYFATMPPKKECLLSAGLYCVYLVVSLCSGQRATIVLGVMLLLIYFIYRSNNDPNGPWIGKKLIITGVVLLPFALVFFALFTHWRAGYSAKSGLFDGIIDFFYQQGYSINVLKLSYIFKDKLPEGKLYSLEFLHTGIIARIFGLPVYEGNTVAHALEGNNLSHALSYLTMGERYLNGHGTGTAYIAELFHDFGVIGVIIGNILLATVLFYCGKLKNNSPFVSTLKLIIIPQLLWVPRGGYTDFISVLLRPSTCVMLLVIFGGEQLLKIILNKYGAALAERMPRLAAKVLYRLGVPENEQ